MAKIYKLIPWMALLIAACAPILPHSTLRAPDGWLYGESYADADSTMLSPEWWLEFNDSTLTSLIEQALLNNRDVASAAARLDAVWAAKNIDRAAYLPQLDIGISGERSRTQTEGIEAEYYIERPLSWEVSLFGALRNTNRAARAAIESSQWAMRGVELSVAAEVATQYFEWCEALGSLAIAERTYKLRRDELALIDSMAYYGMSDGISQEQARSMVMTTASDLAKYRRTADQQRMVLAALIGVTPQEMIDHPNPGNVDGDFEVTIPANMPSDVLERRWDIRESFSDMEAAAAKVGIAHAARYPSISLTGSAGLLSSSIKGLTENKPFMWSWAAEIIQPILGWGKLRGAERAAVADYRQALMEYEQSMLTALSQVEQALIALSTYGRQYAAIEQMVVSNRAVVASVEALYDNGMNDYLNVIDAERELYDSQMELVAMASAQRVSYISLCRALGGGVVIEKRGR